MDDQGEHQVGVVRENMGGWSGRTQVDGQGKQEGGQGEHRWVVRENIGGWSGRTPGG